MQAAASPPPNRFEDVDGVYLVGGGTYPGSGLPVPSAAQACFRFSVWREGDLTAAHEHFFTAAAKMFLGNIAQQFAVKNNAPSLIAATPAGQHHELGAFMAAVAAMHLGWRAIYLGPSLPAAEIVGAAFESNAAVVALSIVYPEDDLGLSQELRTLSEGLSPNTQIIVGGRAAHHYRSILRRIKAITVKDLDAFAAQLDVQRARAATQLE